MGNTGKTCSDTPGAVFQCKAAAFARDHQVFAGVDHQDAGGRIGGGDVGVSAAGGVEAVLSILSLQHNLVFPSLNFNIRMDGLHFDPVTELLDNVKNDHIMSNSFGFGGNNSALIFSRC